MNKKILTLVLCVITVFVNIIPVYAVGNVEVAPLDTVDKSSASGLTRKFGSASVRTTALAAESSEPVDNDYIETTKTVIYDPETNSYTLRLETYVTGETIIEDTESRIPADIVLVMDHSFSMYRCIMCNGSIDPVGVYKPDLDTSMVYYRGADQVSGAVFYCDICQSWYGDRHVNNYHGGTEYIPEYDNQTENLVQFYTQYANVNCGSSCTHSEYKHPVYKKDLDTSLIYYRTANKNNPVVYCASCDSWYGNTTGNVTKHTTGNHNTTHYYPYKVANDNQYTVIDRFYIPKTCSASSTGELHYPRYIALQDAVYTFLNSIYEDSKGKDGVLGTEDDVKHRVAATSFAGDNTGDNSTNCILSFYDPDKTYSDALTGPKIPFNQVDSATADTYYNYYYQNSLQDVTVDDERAILDTIFASNRLSSETHTYKGMRMAKNILDLDDTYSDSVYANGERNRVVVVFTDGVPFADEAWQQSNTALSESYTIKNDLDAIVYTVATFEGADGSDPQNLPLWSGDSIDKANRFMHLLSSNFPYATKRNASGNEAATNDMINPDLEAGDSYYLSASNAASLNNIFQKIYEQIHDGGANIELDDATVLLDIVSEYFTIDGEPVAYTETLKGIVDGVMQWQSDGANVGTITVNGNRVEVTGFDYSENYVGVDTNNGQTTYRGKKLVVDIPILPADDNTGGKNMTTNTSESGLYYPDENGELKLLENYSVPSADIPTTITVVKNIDGGDIKTFDFTVSVHHLDDYNGNDGSDGNYLDQINGAVTHNFTLADNGSHVIENVAVGTSFTISENANADDYSVSVIVTDADGKDITSTALTVKDGVYTISSVVPSMTVTFTNSIRYADLVINKVVTGTTSPDQDFIFELTNTDTGDTMNLIIPSSDFVNGKGSVTVARLLIGNYTVKELNAWSNRYTLKSAAATNDTAASLNGNAISIKFTNVGETITFTNERTDDLWLSGDCYAENYFADTGVKRKD